MAGIYIHIPFCKSKCSYCNFFSVASMKHQYEVPDAICKEIGLTRHYLEGEPVVSVYFGGGTPSLLDAAALGSIMDEILRHHRLETDAEVTVEMNPDDVTLSKLGDYRAMGINRVSIGIQSFSDADLRYLDRRHDAATSLEALNRVMSGGFRSVSADLIFGIPGQSVETLHHNLMQCVESGVQHLSCYNLTVEPRTTLAWSIRKGHRTEPPEEEAAVHFALIRDTLKKQGFMHYEISNYAKEGHIALHNSHYWLRRKYLGLGPSAHSFNLVSRRWNHASVTGYLEGVEAGNGVSDSETLGPREQCNEFIMTRLRTMWGLDIREFNRLFGESEGVALLGRAVPFMQDGLLEKREEKLLLTRAGQLLADRIAADLFAED